MCCSSQNPARTRRPEVDGALPPARRRSVLRKATMAEVSKGVFARYVWSLNSNATPTSKFEVA